VGFSALDFAVLAAYLSGITAFGAAFRRTQHSIDDYFLGSRRSSWLVVGVSIVATETSTLTLIGVPALAYAAYARPEQGGSLMYLQVVAGYVIARFVIGWLLVPAYFEGRLFTAYELLTRGFGARARHVTASLFLVMRALAEGVRTFAAALVLAAVLSASLPGVPHLWIWSTGVVGVLTLVYTFEGGIAAVVWTDLIQFVIYIVGSLVAAAMIVHLVPGGWNAVVADAARAGKLRAVSWSLDPTLPFTFWAGVIGGCFLTMASHGTDQLLVQRLLMCRSARDSRRALVFSGFVVFAQFALFLWIGLMLHAYYAGHPLPPMATTDEIFPAFIVRSLPHGIAGLVIAAIFAAAMSTLSGSLNSLASTTLLDFWEPLRGRGTDAGRLRLSRRLTVAWGISLMAIAVLARNWGSVFTTGLTIASIVYGPMLGAFLLGVLTTRTNESGAIAGIVASLAAMVAIRVFTPLAWTWYVLVGTFVCATVGLTWSAAAAAVVRPSAAALAVGPSNDPDHGGAAAERRAARPPQREIGR
jgi:SSS family solute:Na+ symporter